MPTSCFMGATTINNTSFFSYPLCSRHITDREEGTRHKKPATGISMYPLSPLRRPWLSLCQVPICWGCQVSSYLKVQNASGRRPNQVGDNKRTINTIYMSINFKKCILQTILCSLYISLAPFLVELDKCLKNHYRTYVDTLS